MRIDGLIRDELGPEWWKNIDRIMEVDELWGEDPKHYIQYPYLRIILKDGTVINFYAEGDESAHLEVELLTRETM